jgi:NhaA family Na+:H+ antiporter
MSRHRERSKPYLADRVAAPIQRFLAIETASTILLLLAAVVALAWANSPWAASYAGILHTPLGVSLGPWELRLPLEHWVNDGLMALFFFLVGMEIKHELAHGELSSRDRAMLPLFGAVGGMIAPAGIYLLLHAGGPAAAGWGVPMATDIAFAVAALAVLGPRVPSGLKVFLLALAIVDDLGAVTVIALFYTHGISSIALAAAALGLVLIYTMHRVGVRAYGPYWIVGLVVWDATLASGVHATVAGVLLGFLTPTEPLHASRSLVSRARDQFEEFVGILARDAEGGDRKHVARKLGETARDALSPLDYLTATLHPWVAFVVMPVFAFANAGVALDPTALADPLAMRVSVGIALGLLLGKPLGVTLFSWLAVRLRIAALPQGVGWSSIVGAGILAGIGFTMALFITALAFQDTALVAASKVGILAASLLATAAGLIWLVRALPAAKP